MEMLVYVCSSKVHLSSLRKSLSPFGHSLPIFESSLNLFYAFLVDDNRSIQLENWPKRHPETLKIYNLQDTAVTGELTI